MGAVMLTGKSIVQECSTGEDDADTSVRLASSERIFARCSSWCWLSRLMGFLQYDQPQACCRVSRGRVGRAIVGVRLSTLA